MNRDELRHLAESGAEVHVVGLASTEGAALVRYLWDAGIENLVAHDFLAGDALRRAFMRLHVGMPKADRSVVWTRLQSLPIARRTGDAYLSGIDGADAIFVGQGWYLYPANFPHLPAARERGAPFHTLTELYFDLATAPIVAVTGSNGKSTTSRLVAHILETAGLDTYFAGNERRSIQVLDRLDAMGAEARLVLEVSNRQLLELERPTPWVGAITNVLPNHLDEHGGSFERYAAVKRNLVAHQAADAWAVLNYDDPESRRLADGLPGQVCWFSAHDAPDANTWVADGRLTARLPGDGGPVDLGAADAGPLLGEHNVSNRAAAALVSLLAGADPEAVRRGIRTFRALRHRLQLVWRHADVTYYDDLNSTTPQSTTAALAALDRPVVLIAGGDDKGLSYVAMAEQAQRRVKLAILLPGDGSDRVADALAGVDVPVRRMERFDAAVRAAREAGAPGDAVLLSPACPGFFSRHYLEAGAEAQGFRRLLRELTLRDRTPEGSPT